MERRHQNGQNTRGCCLHSTGVKAKQGRLLFFRENEIEAILVNVNEVFSHFHEVFS